MTIDLSDKDFTGGKHLAENFKPQW